ncbi:hypothetical protein PACTADRAFT_49352 [Pachysolen tannophilus NRRL Y-2460]|uniref:Large ribosomal subunit protein mL49 n=1 Tax=Pachysolen tannophilus NRRL Y-2460 TaxID=669874 RepID=A0A1E4TW07_PACTA|nr:hypothetical protein PACTADRAFT_49352 [Pachysolen tannophilus NRRL Y-2460]
MFKSRFGLACQEIGFSIRFNSTSAASGDSIVSKAAPSKIFPKLSEINVDELYGNKAFGVNTKTYHVSRSKFNHLPVYKTIKSKNIYTEIRKIKGDIVSFRNDLQESLPYIDKNAFKCVMESKKILIKGDFTDDVKNILAAKF